jgi:hypothetical protein
MFTLRGERVYFLCERGVGSAQMADQIDPERLNPNLPLVIQTTELGYGTTTPFVSRTLCAANEIFQQVYLPKSVLRDDALSAALLAAQALGEVQDNANVLAESEAEVRRQIDARELKLHVVPKTKNLKGLVEGAVQNLREVGLQAQHIADMFYPRGKATAPFTPHLRGALQAQLAADDPVWEHLEWSFRQIERLFAYRNALIHPDDTKRLILRDYTLESDGTMIAPTIEVIHATDSLPRMDVGQFIRDALESASLAFETFVAVLSDRNSPGLPGMRTFLVEEQSDLRTGTRFRWQAEWLEGFPKNIVDATSPSPESAPAEPEP